jgi:hypothetical protein
VGGDESGEIVWRDPDEVEDAQVRQPAIRAEAIHGGGSLVGVSIRGSANRCSLGL